MVRAPTLPGSAPSHLNRLIVSGCAAGGVRSVEGVRWAGSRTACRPVWPGLITMCRPVGPLPWRGSKEVRPLIDLELGLPATGSPPELEWKGAVDGGSD